jgi:hypothetical protein
MEDFTNPHIYKRQIIATSKFYIGKHKGGDKYYKGSGKEYKQDLNCYKEYKTEILEYVDDISKLNEREMYWLNKFDVVNNPLYYNLTNRSYGINTCTKEHKQKISIANTGKKRSEQVKYKMSISNTNKGIKPVIQYDKQGNIIREWKSISEATNKLNLSKGRISSCCRKINKTAGGYIWRFQNDPLNNNYVIPSHKSSIPIIQYDKQGNIIREWKSISEAIKQTKIKGILNNVSGRSKTAGGYIFTYKNI